MSAFFALTAVAALLAPLAGPAIDHHFAERQPDHLHFGAPGEHTHAFEQGHHSHSHSHSYSYIRHRPADNDDNPIPVALYKSEAAIAVTLAASPADVDAASMRRFQPTSVLILPTLPPNPVRQHTPHPPDRPPAPV